MWNQLYKNDKDDDYLSEFKQKIAAQQQEDFEERRRQLQRSRNGFIGTIAGIALAGVVSWFILAPRYADTSSAEVPVIRRPVSPAKIQPSDPGGMEIPNQDKSVYNLVEKKDDTMIKAESLLPLPETPQMPVIVANAETIEEVIDAVTEESVSKDPLEIKPLTETIEGVKASNGQKINIPEKPENIKSEVKTSPAAPATTDSSVSAPAAASATPAAAAKGHWQIQLTASTNKAAVERAWTDQAKKYAVLSGLPHEVESVKGDKGTIYRLKAGDYATRAEADALCAKIKAAGGSCLVKQK